MPSPLLRVIEGVLQGRVQVKQLEDALKQRRADNRRAQLQEMILQGQYNERYSPEALQLQREDRLRQNTAAQEKAAYDREVRARNLATTPATHDQAVQWAEQDAQRQEDREFARNQRALDWQEQTVDTRGRIARRMTELSQPGAKFTLGRERALAEGRLGIDESLADRRRGLAAGDARAEAMARIGIDESLFTRQLDMKVREAIALEEARRGMPLTPMEQEQLKAAMKRNELLGLQIDAFPETNRLENRNIRSIIQERQTRMDLLNQPQGQAPSVRESLSDQLRRYKARDDMSYRLFDTVTADVDLPAMWGSLEDIHREAIALGIDPRQLWNQLEVISTQDVVNKDGEILEEGKTLQERLGDAYMELQRKFLASPPGTLGEYGPPLPPGSVSLNTSPYPDGFDPNMPIPNGRPQKPVPTGWIVPGYGSGMSEAEADALLDAMLRMEGY